MPALVPFGEEHLAELGEMLLDPDLLRFTRVPEPVPPGFARTWLERYEEGRHDARGVATEALRQLTEWAFGELDLLRLELMISVANEGSKKVAERCGYVREGVLRSAHIKQDVWEHTEIWSRLATDR